MERHPEETARLLRGEVLIDLAWLPDGVIGAKGDVFINAAPDIVWQMLTDYNNLQETMPKVTASCLVEENGHGKIIEQSGKSGIFIFEKSVRFTLKVVEEYPKHLHFEQTGGDFRVYEGDWFLEAAKGELGVGTLLTYEAKVKPAFFAPPFLVSFVQSQDLPTILKGIRKFCECQKPG
jgi:carbon monoxide dehydrogenase subunit G